MCRMSQLGKGSTAGGSIREAGGSLGEMGAVHEDDYFFKEVCCFFLLVYDMKLNLFLFIAKEKFGKFTS